ncbi:MAG: GxxExxY protein [Candidatus Methylophosphatis roskildensis]
MQTQLALNATVCSGRIGAILRRFEPGILSSRRRKSAQSVDEDFLNSDPQAFAIIGAAMAVYRELGHGFREAVYQEALCA